MRSIRPRWARLLLALSLVAALVACEPALADAGGIDGSTHRLLVSGATASGQAISGVDDVRVVGKR